MTKDLRSYLAELERERPEEVLHIERELKAKWEFTALQVKLEKEGKYPVIIAESSTKVSGERSQHRLITNLMASRGRCAEAIGVPLRRVAELYTQKSNKTRKPAVVSRQQAPVKEVVLKGAQVDLGRFPIVWHHELDPGPYITAGFCTTIEPESGIPNISLQRCQIKGRDKMGWFPDPKGHNFRNLTKWWERGEDCPVAVWVGHHPGAYLGGLSYHRLGYPEDHYPYIGGLLEEDLRVVPTDTFPRLLVPADAEVVIEGVCPKDTWEAEGPFGERPGYTGGQRPNPVIQVTAITCRRDAYWQDILVGHRDNHLTGGFAVECQVYERVKRTVPELINVHAPASAGCRDHVYLQVRKNRPGVGRQALVSALAQGPKHAFVFDEDVDIFDERQVLWAIATRSQWDRDLIVISDLHGTFLDPSLPSHHWALTAKAGLDCTRPAPLEPGLPQFFSPVSQVPQEVLARINPEDFVPAEKLQQIPVER